MEPPYKPGSLEDRAYQAGLRIPEGASTEEIWEMFNQFIESEKSMARGQRTVALIEFRQTMLNIFGITRLMTWLKK